MKYYGIRRKIQQEDCRYALQKTHARIKSKIPGKEKELRVEWYKEQYTSDGNLITHGYVSSSTTEAILRYLTEDIGLTHNEAELQVKVPGGPEISGFPFF